MSKVCSICGKGRLSGNKVSHSNRNGNKVSHSNRKYRRAWGANVQKVELVNESGKTERAYVCTRCLRTMNKNGAIDAD